MFEDEELGRMCMVALPLVEREPLYHLRSDADDSGVLSGGYPMASMYGAQGPRVRGWLRRFNPEVARALHCIEGLNRSPAAHAVILDVAGNGALAKIGRALATRSRKS